MNKQLLLALLVVVLFFSTNSIHAQTNSNMVDEVVWVVGDEAILRSEVERIRTQYGNNVKGNPYCVIPEQLAIQKLFLHQAAIDSIEVSETEINQYVEQDMSSKVMMAGSKEKLEEYMRMPVSQIREMLYEQFKNELTVRSMRQKLTSNLKVTPAEVRRYFKEMPEDSLPFIPVQVEVQILVQKPKIPQSEIDRVKEQLRSWADRVNTGNTSFSTLARFYSEDEGSRRQGGEMDYMGRGDLDPAFANVAFSLTTPGKVSKVVQSEFGYHIIQLVDKRGDKIKCRHILRRPEIAQSDIDASLSRLDSIASDIKEGKFTFEEGAQVISDDKDTRNNHGIMTNVKEGSVQTTRFEMGELPTEVARLVAGMEVGEISAPFTMIDKRGSQVCAIIKLKGRIPAHRASIQEDFQVLKSTVEDRKSEEIIKNWISEKQKNTYVRINEEWRSCEFQYPGWVK